MRPTLFIRILATAALAITMHCAASADAASQELVSTLLSDNARWLKPDVQGLSYTFRMKHTNRDDHYEVQIEYTSPGTLSVHRDGDERAFEIDNQHESNNTAFPPRLLTILQGATLFGPLQELAIFPQDFQLTEIDGELEGQPHARAMKLSPTGQPSQKALTKWKEEIDGYAAQPEHWYRLTPVVDEQEGQTRAVIRLESLFNEGPGWQGLQADLEADPTSVVWKPPRTGRFNVTETYQALLLPTRDGAVALLLKTSGGSAEFLSSALIMEGESTPNETLREVLTDAWPRPKRMLPIRVGCGVWGSWYGYSGGGAFEDRIWIDESTGVVLREEGFDEDGSARFTIDYGDFKTLADGKQVPQHVVVRLRDDESPWTFDMRFSTHGGAVWLLDKLTEFQGDEEVATAWISDVSVE